MPTFSFLTDPVDRQLSQIITLYQQAGWWETTEPNESKLVARIIKGSHCFVIATEEDEIIGMGRAISDRASDAYIQDVTTKKQFRDKGIGKQIISMIISRLKNDQLDWIGLIAEPSSLPFYENLGFQQMKDSVPVLLKNNEF